MAECRICHNPILPPSSSLDTCHSCCQKSHGVHQGSSVVRTTTRIREARNLTGKNQWGGSWVEREPLLPKWIQEYLNLGMKQKDIVTEIKKRKNGTGPSLRTIQDIIQKYDLTTARNHKLTDDDAGAHIIKEIEQDNLRRSGYHKIHEDLMRSGVHMPRDFVQIFLRQLESDKVDQRYVTAKKQAHPAKLTCAGPNAEWSCDGHDKLIRDMGISVWGIMDKYSRRIMRYFVVPWYKRSDIAAALYLQVVKEHKGIPFQLSLDKGSETNHAAAIQITLCLTYDPERDIDVYPPYRGLKSTANITIEKGWRPFFANCLENILVEFLKGKHAGTYHPENEVHQQIARWVWAKTTELEVKQYVERHNSHRIRYQDGVLLPTGGSPNQFFNNPGETGGRDCLIPVDERTIDGLIEDITPPDLFQWTTPEVDAHCTHVYAELGCPDIELPIAWNVIHIMITRWID